MANEKHCKDCGGFETNEGTCGKCHPLLGTIIPGTGEPSEELVRSIPDTDPQEISQSRITRKEWAQWYQAIGEIKRGMYYPKTGSGYLIQIGNKIFITNGTYSAPKLIKAVAFANAQAADRYIAYKAKKRR